MMGVKKMLPNKDLPNKDDDRIGSYFEPMTDFLEILDNGG